MENLRTLLKNGNQYWPLIEASADSQFIQMISTLPNYNVLIIEFQSIDENGIVTDQQGVQYVPLLPFVKVEGRHVIAVSEKSDDSLIEEALDEQEDFDYFELEPGRMQLLRVSHDGDYVQTEVEY